MTYKPQSMPGKPDSVIKHQKFSDLMQRYHGQMESALYAAEQACDQIGELCEDDCPFEAENGVHCNLKFFRSCFGDHIQQHDIQIPEDDTQAQRKRER